MAEIRVYHSFRSPYSRLGLHILNQAGLTPELIPFTGPPEGDEFFDPVTSKSKRAYYMLDVPRMTMRMGLAIRPPDPFDVDLTPSYKAAVAAERDGVGMPFALAVCDARWGEGRNISDLEVLKDCAKQVDWTADEVETAQSALSVGKTLKKQRQYIEEDGVFGVPFAVYGASKYWGHDRFNLLVEEVAS